MNPPAIEAVDVTKRFGGSIAVKSANVSIEIGEFFSLLGPSGCGKTTLLRMIAGFARPDEGKILIAGREMNAVPPHKRPVNMVFQSYALFPHLNVFDNVAFGLRTRRNLAKHEIEERVKEALELVRLGSFGDRLPAQLSGGQQQRVAFARAVVIRPLVLLLDEPLSALDPQIREEMQEELARLHNRLNLTFVMVTHDQSEALALSSRVAVLNRGVLEQVGTPLEMYEQPKSLFVAKFIGNTNLLGGRLTDKGSASQPYTRVAIGEKVDMLVRENPDCASVTNGNDVTVWIKPQSIRLCAHGSPGANGNGNGADGMLNTFEMTVSMRSYQGASTDYVLRDEHGMELRASCSGEDERKFAAGDKVMVSVPASAASYLPGHTD